MNRVLSLPDWGQKTLAVSILAGMLFLLNALFASAIGKHLEANGTKLERSYQQLERLDALAKSAPLIRQNIQTVLQDQRLVSGILPSSSTSQATSAVQARIRKCILQAGGDIRSITDLPPQTTGTLQAVGVAVTATMTPSAFDAMLSQFESGQPTLFVESIDIQMAPSERRRLQSTGDEETNLIFNLSVVGLTRTGESG